LIVVQGPAKATKSTAIPCSEQRKHIAHRRLCSNSQLLKQRQLTHGARNRAGQSIVVQGPAKSTKTTAILCSGQRKHITHRRLISTHRTESSDSWPTVLGIVPPS
jgi:hypothetical protein